MPVPTMQVPIASRMIDKQLLGDSIYERLLSDIILGRYMPEERLNVDAIAEEFGVSRTPVREAIIRLSSAGFVEVVRNSRTQVAEWSAADMRDRLEVGGRLVCLVIRDSRLDLSRLVGSTQALGLDPTPTADTTAFLDFVERIINNGSNAIADTVLFDLMAPLRLFFREEVIERHQIDLAGASHSRTRRLITAMDAVAAGRAGEAQQLLDAYVMQLASAVWPKPEDD
ncbi:GntR family transcriptional regulator [Plantibacter sp. Mn2098]|uniref:GntR family transcriptional regulator n=1 Tax=Plantibacter sp. Mn2098 TaxID=3395266 RepID=UPI003BC5393F